MSNVPTNLIPTRITGLPEYTGDSTLGFMPYVLEGRTYKVQFSNIAAVGAVPSSRVIATGNGLEGGGDLSQNRTISIISHGVGYSQLSFTGVVAGTYGAADTIPAFTVDATGRITSVTDTPIVLSNYVPTSRTITAGPGLTGGGQLSGNLTVSLNPSNATPQSLGVAFAGTGTQAARDDHVHPAVDLTDTSETQGVLPLGRGGTGVALSPVVGAVIYADNDSLNQTIAGNAGQVLTSAGGLGAPYWQTITGTGTVTDVSVATANGFAGTVADPNTTPEITLSTTVSGMVKGDGTALSAAVAGTDYVAPGAVTTSGLTMATARLLGRTTAGTGAVEEITVGTGLSLSAGSLVNSAPDQVVSLASGTGISVSGSYPSFTITNTAPDQIVSLTAGTGMSVSGSYPSFTLTNTAPDQIVSLTGGGTTVVTGTYPNFTITSNDAYTGTVTSVAASGGTTGLTFSGSPITTSGTLTLGGTLAVANGGTGATTAAGARTNLGAAASGANSDITSLSGLTGAISSPTYIQYGNGSGTTLAAGRMWYDQTTGSMNVGMGGGNITQQIGEELFVYGKASAAITEGQVVVKTGAVGASGVITFAPAPLGTTDSQAIIGVATENIALNGFGRITAFGVVHGINTTGSAYGETWADGDTLYYNPAYVGGLTKVKPSAPNQKTEVGIVINAGSGGSGSIQVEIIHGTVLGGTDSNVQLTSPTDNDLLQYYAAGPYWRNLAPSSVSVGTATNLAGGAANRIAYQTGAGATGFITAPSVANTFLEWSGSAFQWSANPLGTVTSVAASGGTTGLTFSGSPITTSGTLTLGGTLNVANGGTGLTTLTANYVYKGNGTSALAQSLIYDTGSAVGIGTTGPASLFEISKAGAAIGYATSTTAVSLSRWTARNTDASLNLYCSISALTTGVGDVGTTSNHPLTFTTNNSERMRLDTSGNFAVGTTSANSFRTYVKQSSANQAGLAVAASAATTETRIFNDGTLAGVASSYSGTASFLPLTFWTSDAEQMRVTTGGNLALGTTTAASTSGKNITIGGIEPSLVLNASGARSFSIASGGNYQYTGNTLSFIDNTAGTTRMLIDSSGNVGIGTSSPGAKLHVNGGASTLKLTNTDAASFSGVDFGDGTNVKGQIWVGNASYASFGGAGSINYSANSGPHVFYTNYTEGMRLTSAGRLGIGVTAPADALDVKSAIYVTSPSSVSMPAVRASNFGYSTGYSAVVFGATSGNVTPCINVDPIANTSGSFPGNGNEVMFRNGVAFETPNAANNSYHTNIIVMKDGNVGVGVTPSAWSSFKSMDLGVGGTIASWNGYAELDLGANYYYNGANFIYKATGAAARYSIDPTVGSHMWFTAASGSGGAALSWTERARIDSSGNFLIGTTSAAGKLTVVTTTSGQPAVRCTGLTDARLSACTQTSGTSYFDYFLYNGTNTGSITSTGTTTAYNITSDRRLKYDIVDAPEASTLIDAIKVRSFKWNVNGSEQRYGMIAQELDEVAPEAVTHGRTEDDMMSVDYSKLVPMLIKEVQSLRARVAELEGK